MVYSENKDGMEHANVFHSILAHEVGNLEKNCGPLLDMTAQERGGGHHKSFRPLQVCVYSYLEKYTLERFCEVNMDTLTGLGWLQPRVEW